MLRGGARALGRLIINCRFCIQIHFTLNSLIALHGMPVVHGISWSANLFL